MLLFLVFLLHLAIFGRTGSSCPSLTYLCFFSGNIPSHVAARLTRKYWLAANRRCPEVHFWNGTDCKPCSVCPVGEGVKIGNNCSLYKDTQCQSCWPGYDYSNTTGMEACQRCDQNCLLGNFKVIKKCNVSSDSVCDRCKQGSYFNPDQGEQGGCVECSPRCRVDEVETTSCKTEHNRVCSKPLTTQNILTPTTLWKETDNSSTDDTTATLRTDDTDEDPTYEDPTGARKREEDEPFYKKSWIWIVVSVGFISIALPTVVLTAVKYRQTPSDPTVLQQLPLIPRGLDQPIQTLLVEQRSFIAMLLDCKDSLGYGYWQRVAEELNLADECRAFTSLPNPTEAFLTLYSEKQGSTVRALVDATVKAGLTHFASKMREKFGARDHEDIEAGEHDSAV